MMSSHSIKNQCIQILMNFCNKVFPLVSYTRELLNSIFQLRWSIFSIFGVISRVVCIIIIIITGNCHPRRQSAHINAWSWGHQADTVLALPPAHLAEKTTLFDTLPCFHFSPLWTFLLNSSHRVDCHCAVATSRVGILIQSSPIWHQSQRVSDHVSKHLWSTVMDAFCCTWHWQVHHRGSAWGGSQCPYRTHGQASVMCTICG